MKRPKIGLALSGASGRALAHAGVLDVLDEEGIPIDYIAAVSSGSIIASAYATNTLRDLKREAELLTKKELFRLFGPSENTSGFFSLDKAQKRLQQFAPGNIEDAKPQLAFVTVDVETGEQVAISMGNMVKGIVASCSIPGLFETVKWGNRHLVDGGLLNIVPADVVRAMGADIVISVDIAASKYVFSDTSLKLIQRFIWLAKTTGLPYTFTKKLVTNIKSWLAQGNYIQFYSQSDFIDESEKLPSIVHVMGKVIEISRWREDKIVPFESISDIVLQPKVKSYGRTEFSLMRKSYVEGREAAKAVVPRLVKMMEDVKLGKRKPVVGNYTKETLIGDLEKGLEKLK